MIRASGIELRRGGRSYGHACDLRLAAGALRAKLLRRPTRLESRDGVFTKSGAEEGA
jgi:hypothetical protein